MNLERVPIAIVAGPAADEGVFAGLVAGDGRVDGGAGVCEWPGVDVAEYVAGVCWFEGLEDVLAVRVGLKEASGIRRLIVE